MRILTLLTCLLFVACAHGANPVVYPDGCERTPRATLKVVNQSSYDFVVRYLPTGSPRIRANALRTTREKLPRSYMDDSRFRFHLRQATGFDHNGPQTVSGRAIRCNVGTLKILPQGDAIFFGADL